MNKNLLRGLVPAAPPLCATFSLAEIPRGERVKKPVGGLSPVGRTACIAHDMDDST